MGVPLPPAVAIVLCACGISTKARTSSLLASRMVLPLLPSLLIASLLRLALWIRASVSGMLSLATWSSDLRDPMATRIPCTRSHSHQTERISCLEVWTRPSRCGSLLLHVVDILAMRQRVGVASGPLRVTRYVNSINFIDIRFTNTSKRTSFYPLRLRPMETGFSPAPKTAVSNSGTPELVTLNSCCRATRTASSQWHQVQAVDPSPPVAEICGHESGVTSHISPKEISLNIQNEGSCSLKCFVRGDELGELVGAHGGNSASRDGLVYFVDFDSCSKTFVLISYFFYCLSTSCFPCYIVRLCVYLLALLHFYGKAVRREQ